MHEVFGCQLQLWLFLISNLLIMTTYEQNKFPSIGFESDYVSLQLPIISLCITILNVHIPKSSRVCRRRRSVHPELFDEVCHIF